MYELIKSILHKRDLTFVSTSELTLPILTNEQKVYEYSSLHNYIGLLAYFSIDLKDFPAQNMTHKLSHDNVIHIASELVTAVNKYLCTQLNPCSGFVMLFFNKKF